uniref:Uncharacterized protein n=1 Tax=Rangifer tarandus platyrhynchus TaxID=3082113 RepID=A0ACB0E698_RANTA|nr:unnamed protein product [Rangifer tarandus platyrhynchus]
MGYTEGPASAADTARPLRPWHPIHLSPKLTAPATGAACGQQPRGCRAPPVNPSPPPRLLLLWGLPERHPSGHQWGDTVLVARIQSSHTTAPTSGPSLLTTVLLTRVPNGVPGGEGAPALWSPELSIDTPESWPVAGAGPESPVPRGAAASEPPGRLVAGRPQELGHGQHPRPVREPESLGHGWARQRDPEAQGPADQLLCKNRTGPGNSRPPSL